MLIFCDIYEGKSMRVEFKLSWALKPAMNNQVMRHYDKIHKKSESEVAPYRKLGLF